MAIAFRIDEPLKDFIESGLAGIVGTASAEGLPHVTYGWSPRVHPDGASVDVFLDQPRAEMALSDIAENGQIALTLADPVSYRSVQLKGKVVGSTSECAKDETWLRNGREGYLVRATLIGDDPRSLRERWFDDVVRVTFSVDSGFDQTPGPTAGQPL